jgi:lactate dehydrogenase-like 2-hydroxyacid dehydrogenase
MSRESGSVASVFVASRFLSEVENELRAAFDATFASIEDQDRAELRGAAGKPLLVDLAQQMRAFDREFDAVLISLDVPLPAEAIAGLPDSVRAIATYSVGTDHIDLGAAAERGIAVFNTPGVLSDSVAENAIFLMLGAARRATESIELIRSRAWPGWNPTQLVGVELSGRRLGILGLGDIGERVAIRAQALGMEILYYNRRPIEDDASKGFTYRATPEELIADSDVFLIGCPSTSETRGRVDAALLEHAKAGLILVNIARGDIVEDGALIAALDEGRVWAAGLDVFASEPNVAAGYFDLPNVFMLPHIGSSTLEARLRMGRILIEALELWCRGGDPKNRVC